VLSLLGLATIASCGAWALRVRRHQKLEAAYRRMMEHGDDRHERFFQRVLEERTIAGYAAGAEGMTQLTAASAFHGQRIARKLAEMELSPILWASSSSAPIRSAACIGAIWLGSATALLVISPMLGDLPEKVWMVLAVLDLLGIVVALLCIAWLLSTVYALTPGFAIRIRSIGCYEEIKRVPWSQMSSLELEYGDEGIGTLTFGAAWCMDRVISAEQAHKILEENGVGRAATGKATSTESVSLNILDVPPLGLELDDHDSYGDVKWTPDLRGDGAKPKKQKKTKKSKRDKKLIGL